MTTIDDAIKHEEERAAVLESTCTLWKSLSDAKGLVLPSDYEFYKNAAEGRRQVAAWLKELKALKEESNKTAYFNGVEVGRGVATPQGKWIVHPQSMIMRCSLCGNEETAEDNGIVDTNKHFCSNCGAKMDESGAEK